MKRRTISLFLSLAIIISLCITPAYAASLSSEQEAQIAQLEQEIADLQTKMSAYGTSVGVIGTVVDTTSYYIIKGSGVDMSSIIGGVKYCVIDNPQDGYNIYGTYAGRHKKLGTITVTLNGKSITCTHYGTMGTKYYELFKEKTEKEKQIDKIKAAPEILTKYDIRSLSGGNRNEIVMQIANTSIYAYWNDVIIDAPPVLLNGSAMLPLRVIIELSYGTVNWDSTTDITTIKLGSNVITLKSNSTTATVNGNTVIMPAAAQVINSRLMVPVRFVAENLGMKVTWLSDYKVIVIDNPNYTNDLMKSYLALSDGYYTVNQWNGCTFKYPASWKYPSIDDKDMSLSMPYAMLSIKCEWQPSGNSVNKARSPGSNYETVKLTDKNSGIEAIVRTTDAYSKNSNTGEVLILGSNGYLFTFSWILNSMDSGLDQTISDVVNIANSFSEENAVG